MEPLTRIERSLQNALSFAVASDRPPMLCAAVRHAVFPGGARVRPRLCLAVATACGDPDPTVSDAAAAALELLHCASLVHDDMPCFDNAETRRGFASVQARYGEPLALLTGDALIVLAFETLARGCATRPDRMISLTATIARAVGMPHGIVAGQGWESEADIPLAEYHRTKTASLFMGATAAGAAAAGRDPQPWFEVGEKLGAAYQVADDLGDMLAGENDSGKPHGQDSRNARPNAGLQLGVGEACDRLRGLVDAAVRAIPNCAGREGLSALVRSEATRLVPKSLALSAA